MSINTKQKLSLPRLTAIVFGSIIGMGIFNLAQNMGATADVAAVAVSWGIMAVGMLLLVLTFKILADHRPDLQSGIYQYAREGFGDYAGFNIAWGYWLCTAFGNVAYAVMLNDAVGAFVPGLRDHGVLTVIVCSMLIWGMFLVVSRGIRTASYINLVMTFVKLLTIAMILVLLVAYFDRDTFTLDVWGSAIAPFGEQVRSTMMIILWCFIGIEGAVVMSSRARRPSDVGKAGLIGFALSWILYFLVAILCFGIMSQPELARLDNPSLAYVLVDSCGKWVYYFVVVAVIISLAGGWLAWTLICSQVPFETAKTGIFPRLFLKTNAENTPINGLIVATITMQLFIFIVVSASSVYTAAVEMTGMMVLPAYLFCGLFLLKATFRPERYLGDVSRDKILKYRLIAIPCIIFCLWMIYAGGVLMMMATSIFYLPGVYFYRRARLDKSTPSNPSNTSTPSTPSDLSATPNPSGTIFTHGELVLLIIIAISAIISLSLIFSGNLEF